ncbi:ephrin type-A receptor 4 isoform X2 [Aethina tumida]|uniref:ephrin type-A receptor 4 isoform X2 n=1 Tax=Aethina tumida TaxID=116153 RepID=UPI0021487247|nr:ephrin type-A receptor 4 isoform X2 [Aethina tumida]
MGLWARFLPLLALTIWRTFAEQVVLLDTTGEASLDWTRYPYGPQANTPGWVEESFTNFQKGINWRSYVVCDVAYNNVNNWLWTPFIDRGVANRIYIEIKFTIRDCSLFPGNALSCKETFSLLYYEFDAATREPPPWDAERYKLIGRIAAGDGRFNTNSEVNINTEVKSIPVTKKGVYFAFRDQGACISLLAIKIYYITCPETTINFAKFPATPTGKEITIIEQAQGTCVSNAEMVGGTPTYLCKGDGKWTLPTNGCKCKAGFEPNFEKQTCNVCQPETYKSETGDGPCLPCPKHSVGSEYALTECRCVDGYYRAATDPKNMSCTQPPSEPLNLTVTFVDQSQVALSWLPPENLGGRTDTVYRVKCDACVHGLVQYTPSSETFNETKVSIRGLNAVTTYRFQIFAENGVSHLLTRSGSKYADVVVTTEASVTSNIPNVRVTSVKSTEITLAWDAPTLNDGSESVETYEVRWYVKNDADHNATSILTRDLKITITDLNQRTEYGLQVRAKTENGWGDYSPVIFKTTGQVLNTAYSHDDEGFRIKLVAGGIVAIVVILVGVIVLTVVFLRSRSNDECNKKQPSDCDTLEYRNGEVTTPLFTGISGSSRTYIDPHTYEDPNQAVREFAREIDASCITIEAIIGGGEFGDVCKGKLKLNGIDIDVAIKTLKVGSLDKSRNDFLTEASIMGQFEHPNVIFLQGVVTKSNPVMIITEYMENGSLDTFLRANDGKFQVIQLTGMLRGIASGMQYLSEMNYVHRDLAARNVLVNTQLVCKIADFGLSREIESATEGAYTTRGGKIPVRWTAPEAIAFRKFTSASDVWSMGIVCWEVMSYGERPYWNWSNQDVIKSIEKGYRLPAPMDCPEAIYQLMLDCWQKERTHRPTFQSIVKTLDKLIRVPDTLRKIAQNRSRYLYTAKNPWGGHDVRLSDLSSRPNPSQNVYFNSLQRRPKYTPNIVEAQPYNAYGLPDIIRYDANDYLNSVVSQELKRRFSSLLNIREETKMYNEQFDHQMKELNTDSWIRAHNRHNQDELNAQLKQYYTRNAPPNFFDDMGGFDGDERGYHHHHQQPQVNLYEYMQSQSSSECLEQRFQHPGGYPLGGIDEKHEFSNNFEEEFGDGDTSDRRREDERTLGQDRAWVHFNNL